MFFGAEEEASEEDFSLFYAEHFADNPKRRAIVNKSFYVGAVLSGFDKMVDVASCRKKLYLGCRHFCRKG